MRKVIKKEHVRLDEALPALPSSPREAPAPHSPSAAHQPEVRLIRTDQRVTAIEYHCACGENVVFDLDYATEHPTPQAIPAPLEQPSPEEPR